MGLEVRRVAPDWEHPTEADYRQAGRRGGRDRPPKAYPAGRNKRWKPTLDEDFYSAYRGWLIDWLRWKWQRVWGLPLAILPIGPKPPVPYRVSSFEDWYGDAPTWWGPYRPYWKDAERTHLQLYETVSEGTPLSPPMPDAESLARWLAKAGESGKQVWNEEPGSVDHEGWMRFLERGGYAPSAVMSAEGGFQTGVEYATSEDVA